MTKDGSNRKTRDGLFQASKVRSNCYKGDNYGGNSYGRSHHRDGNFTHRSQMGIDTNSCSFVLDLDRNSLQYAYTVTLMSGRRCTIEFEGQGESTKEVWHLWNSFGVEEMFDKIDALFACPLLILEGFGNNEPFKEKGYGMTRDKHENLRIFQRPTIRSRARKLEEKNKEMVALLGRTFKIIHGRHWKGENKDQRSTKIFLMCIMQVEKKKSSENLEDSTSNGEEGWNLTAGSRFLRRFVLEILNFSSQASQGTSCTELHLGRESGSHSTFGDSYQELLGQVTFEGGSAICVEGQQEGDKHAEAIVEGAQDAEKSSKIGEERELATRQKLLEIHEATLDGALEEDDEADDGGDEAESNQRNKLEEEETEESEEQDLAQVVGPVPTVRGRPLLVLVREFDNSETFLTILHQYVRVPQCGKKVGKRTKWDEIGKFLQQTEFFRTRKSKFHSITTTIASSQQPQ
ncbi:hypothetical protein M9H77_12858 [Catharanthus roseus]|uniref:Uncharacterized protein n=1 Tax=Catharanthus roseus TaxID=4058 RepID=A0ACC0BIQ2_CATRO|nr:hypothetical protein M9H77_12858 [Catharanthus roseus]